MREHYGVPDERMFTTYIAVHQRFATLPPTGPALPTADQPGVRQPFFFYPANAWKHKNHETLLLAYGIYRAGALAAGKLGLLATGAGSFRG